MQLSEHFSLEELTSSGLALRKGITNVPSADQIENLKVLAQALEQVRKLLGFPIHIDSGFRSPKLNSAIGGRPNSAHLEGYAADFVAPGFGTPREICQAIEGSDISYDQLILEGTWVHLSFAPTMREEVLTATFTNGKATYTQGVS